MREMILSVIAAVVVVGCSSKPGPTPAPAPAPPAPAASAVPAPPVSSPDAAPSPGAVPHDPSMFTCSTDADCMLVEMGCCDHCNGGWILSVNRAHVDAAMARYRKTDCGSSCTDKACAPPAPFCKGTTCARRRGNIEFDNTFP